MNRPTISLLQAAALVVFAAAFALVGVAPARAMYDPHHGRWLQRDPLGMVPAKSTVTEELEIHYPRDPTLQYADGANLYQYVCSKPGVNGDPHGEYGAPVHQDDTSRWAQNRDRGLVLLPVGLEVAFGGYRPQFAAIIGQGDNDVDSVFGATGWIFGLGWHFDIDTEGGRIASSWDPGDSRYRHAEEQMRIASRLCAYQRGREAEAVRELGRGLHPLQDFYAHGNWRVWYPPSPIPLLHPDWYDHETRDGHGPNGVPVQTIDSYGTTGIPGFRRYRRMREHTFDYLNRFIGEVLLARGPNSEHCLCTVLMHWPCGE